MNPDYLSETLETQQVSYLDRMQYALAGGLPEVVREGDLLSPLSSPAFMLTHVVRTAGRLLSLTFFANPPFAFIHAW